MANYYTEVSFIIEFPTKDGALAALNRLEIMEATEKDEDNEFYTGCTITLQEESSLWIRSDESANVEALADWLEIVVSHMNWNPIYFTWSNTCSKKCTDSFDGGAVVITKDGQHWMNSDRWACEKIEELKSKKYRFFTWLKKIFQRRNYENDKQSAG
jgi:hypothetical protein